jgi:hypothetical protein
MTIINGTTITRAPYNGKDGKQTPSYLVTDGGTLTLENGSAFPPPLP